MSAYRSDLLPQSKGLRVSTHAWNVFNQEERNFHTDNKAVIVVDKKDAFCLELLALIISFPNRFSPSATVLVRDVTYWNSLLPALGASVDIRFCIVPPPGVQTLVLLDPIQISHKTPYESLISFVQVDEEDVSVHYTLYTRSFPAPPDSVDALNQEAVVVIVVDPPEQEEDLDISISLFQAPATPPPPSKKSNPERCDFSAVLYLEKGPKLVTHVPPNANSDNIALFVVTGRKISPDSIEQYCREYSRVYEAHTLVGSKSTLISNSVVISTFDDLNLAYAALCRTLNTTPFVSSAPLVASKAPPTSRLLRSKPNPIAEVAKKIIVDYYMVTYSEYGVAELLHQVTSKLETWYINRVVKRKSLALRNATFFAPAASRLADIDARKKSRLAHVLQPGDDVMLHGCRLVKEWVLFVYMMGILSPEIDRPPVELRDAANSQLSTAQILSHYTSATYLTGDGDVGIVTAHDCPLTSSVVVGHWGDPLEVKNLLRAHCELNRAASAWSLAVSSELRPAIVEYAREKKLLYRVAPLQLPVFDHFVVFYFSV